MNLNLKYPYRCQNKNCIRSWTSEELLPIPPERMEVACKDPKRFPSGICPWCKDFAYEIDLVQIFKNKEQTALTWMQRARTAALDQPPGNKSALGYDLGRR